MFLCHRLGYSTSGPWARCHGDMGWEIWQQGTSGHPPPSPNSHAPFPSAPTSTARSGPGHTHFSLHCWVGAKPSSLPLPNCVGAGSHPLSPMGLAGGGGPHPLLAVELDQAGLPPAPSLHPDGAPPCLPWAPDQGRC